MLLLIYRLFLEKESIHHFKRFYLLGALFFSVFTPLITLPKYVISSGQTIQLQEISAAETMSNNSIWDVFLDNLPIIFLGVYLLGCLLFSIRFLKNLITLNRKINTNTKVKSQYAINVLLNEIIIPHTFFNYIFYQKHQYINKTIPEAVKIHEQTHAKQLHSLDVLLIEIIQIMLWFNPLVYVLKHQIKLNHEFLADQSVLSSGISKSHYQYTLIDFSQSSATRQLASAFNYSSIKKRITIMKTQTPPKTKWLKTLVLIPILGGLFYGFAPKEIIPLNSNGEELVTQKKATQAELNEYNKLAKYYNGQKEPMKVDLKEMKRIHHLYNLMSADQKANAQPLPNFPPPPPPVPKAPGTTDKTPPPPPLPENPTKGQVKAYKESMKQKTPKPPKPPKDPIQVIKEMESKGAVFYFNGKQITAKEALQRASKNKSLNLYTNKSKSKKELQVHLSDKPMVKEIKVKNN
ncbi:MAG: hypothetical protein BM564_04730 [Bacteroidetes bacterium MedPE-SWsnd-G2]|nr:MAG: hypothetical protein BM564_04730 [Bacteroidetes bacterium MedPE-SWsnd-G2]